MKDYINPVTEDKLYEKYMFIRNLQRIIDSEFEESFKMVWKDILKNADNKKKVLKNKDKIETFFFDYMLNNEELVSFEEYLDLFSFKIES